MGVWIETNHRNCASVKCLSLPAWECGLKLPVTSAVKLANDVTPRVGVWIETDVVG